MNPSIDTMISELRPVSGPGPANAHGGHDKTISIRSIESQINRKLPESYAHFLTLYENGLMFDAIICYKPLTSSPWASKKTGMQHVEQFYSLNHGGYSVVKNINIYKNRIPEGYIAIAEAGGGNQILISANEEDYDFVYFWDHEGEVDKKINKTPDKSNLYLISKSFTDFIALLSIEEDDDEGGVVGLKSITLRI